MNKPGLSFRPRACLRCGGDAYLDRSEEREWRCLQCGRIVPEVSAQAAIEQESIVQGPPLRRAA